MNNNDILRRIRYIFDFSDTKMISIFSQGNYEITRSQVSDLLKKDNDPDYQECTDNQLIAFLNGLINEKRGKKEGSQPKVENRITNNSVFKKLKIALHFQDKDILQMMEQVNLPLSKHELSAFFRNTNHKNYRTCKDQVLRNFLNALQLKYRENNKTK